MVRRTITILVIAVTLLGFAIMEVIWVKNIIVTLEKDVDALVIECEQNKDNLLNVSPNVKKIKQKWESDENKLCLIFNHKDMSIITDSLSRLYSYTQNNDYDNAWAEVCLLQTYAEKNNHIMGFNFKNIL